MTWPGSSLSYSRGPRTDMSRPGFEPGPPAWEASTLEKRYLDSLFAGYSEPLLSRHLLTTFGPLHYPFFLASLLTCALWNLNPTFLPFSLPTFLPSYLSPFLPFSLPTFLPFSLSPFLPSSLSPFLPSYLPPFLFFTFLMFFSSCDYLLECSFTSDLPLTFRILYFLTFKDTLFTIFHLHILDKISWKTCLFIFDMPGSSFQGCKV